MTRFNEETRRKEEIRGEEGNRAWVNRMDRMMATFEESMNKMMQINESFLRVVEKGRREIMKLNEKYEKKEERHVGKPAPTHMDLRILLWNARRTRGKKKEIMEHFKETDINVITETKCKQEENINVPGTSIMSNQDANYQAAADCIVIIIRREIQWELFKDVRSSSENIELVGIKIKIEKSNIIIVAIYRRSGRTEKIGVWSNIISQISRKKGDTILLLGDCS